MKISLVHNPTAGDGQDVDDVVRLLTDARHQVRHRSSKGDWQAILQDPGDLVVAAGGDGRDLAEAIDLDVRCLAGAVRLLAQPLSGPRRVLLEPLAAAAGPARQARRSR